MSLSRIGDLVEVPAVRTVIRLEEGRHQAADITNTFVFTKEVGAHLTVLADALLTTSGQGYFLQGDFGSGKSHFLAAVYAWLASDDGDILAERHGGLRRVDQSDKRFLPVDVSLIDYRGATSLEEIILESTRRALGDRLSARPESDDMRSRSHKRATFSQMITEVTASGWHGVVLLVDELSEFFRSKPSVQDLNEDARTLQLLGEMTGQQPLWIIAAVQESIERTGDISQAILRKIKDRFPIKLALSNLHIRSLISERLVRHKPEAEQDIYAVFELYQQQFTSFDVSYDDFRTTYPVHPTTIALLDGLGDLFSQHRGIVDFVYSRIAGDPRRSIAGILDRPASELLSPDSIYDHFSQRIAEFSDFNVYPRHVVPHLDEVIDSILSDSEDRFLARRLVRILVLYRVHPTAHEPPVAQLAELVACSLGSHSAELNTRYIAETLLDPIAASSRFLVKQADPGGDALGAVYAITTEDHPGKVLEARLARVAAELGATDSRLLLYPLGELAESEAWPGRLLLSEGASRSIMWNCSSRNALACLVGPQDVQAADRLAQALGEGFDFGVAFVLGDAQLCVAHTAVLRIPFPQNTEVLKEYLAARLVAAELRPANPSEAPLMIPAEERVAQLRTAAAQAALDAVYAGDFDNTLIRVDPAVRQVKRFDRLLETAGEVILAERYPRFRDVAPRRLVPSLRMYQQLLEQYVIPGSVPLAEAKSRGLSTAIDAMVAPLGLVEIKRNAYIFSPDTQHPLLAFLFGLLQPARPTDLAEVLVGLQSGPYGLPKDTAQFLIASLAVGGLISIIKGKRTLPLQFLSMSAVDGATAVSLGELINDRDKATLTEECTFLAVAEDWASFGLRQQRDTWKEVVKFRDAALKLANDVAARLADLAEFSSLQAFRLPTVQAKLKALQTLVGGILVSYPAKEGLEKFVSTWRGTGLTADDVRFTRRLSRFLARDVDEFVFRNHYLRHAAAKQAMVLDANLAGLHSAAVDFVEDPLSLLALEEDEFEPAFQRFREAYSDFYATEHAAHYHVLRPPSLSKAANRAIDVLMRLSAIETLDRPPGMQQFLEEVTGRPADICRRHVREELVRSPVCGCGFQPGDKPAAANRGDVEVSVEGFLSRYVGILREPKLREALAARAYALRDVNPAGAACLQRLQKLLAAEDLKASRLVGVLDQASTTELGEALSGSLRVQTREMSDLQQRLAGRRLSSDGIIAAAKEWLAEHDADTIIAIEGDQTAKVTTAPAQWWRIVHRELFPQQKRHQPDSGPAVQELEQRLEREFPAGQLVDRFRQLSTDELLHFVVTERLHTRAIQSGYRVLAQRVVAAGEFPPDERLYSDHADERRAQDITTRITTLKQISGQMAGRYPERLALRIPVDQLLADSWTDAALGQVLGGLMLDVEDLAEQWLMTLPAVCPISLEDKPLVVLVDGASADMWLDAMDLIDLLPGKPQKQWMRLEGSATTVDAIAALFAFDGDPVEVFSAHGIPYHQVVGNEGSPLAALVLPLPDDSASVVRLSMIDSAAHQGRALASMRDMLRTVVEQLPALQTACCAQKRPLMVVNDHGISIGPNGAAHGAGKVYERVIFRLLWIP